MFFDIPGKNGEFLCIPQPALIPKLIKSNRDKFKTYNFYVDEIHVHNFRKKVRETVLGLSQQYTSELSLTPPTPFSKGGEIILTGHQPIFYHPGILIKNLLLNRIALSENIAAVNLIVDTDNFKEIGVYIPVYSDGIKVNNEILISNPLPMPYEFSPPPLWGAFELFLRKIEGCLSHPQFKNLYENFLVFKKLTGAGIMDFKTLSDFMTFIRRKYEEEIDSRYLEVPLSNICDTDEFIMFFMSIAKEAESFAGIYNYRLKEYRKTHKLRYPANPFPDLSVDNKRIELPFWHFGFPPARGRIFVEYNGDEFTISFENGMEVNLKRSETDKGIEFIKKNKIKIRPRAITLSLFNRLFVSDVFIHGVGGAKYDTITDGIIRDFYKVEPPEFITVSFTLYPAIPLPVNQGFSPDLIKELERNLRDMRYNPERYLIPATPPLEKGLGSRCCKALQREEGDLIKEKEYLISLVKEGTIHKKEIAKKLKEINEMLYQRIKPAEKEIEEKIKVLIKQQEEMKAIQRRDYPYFLFSPEEIGGIIRIAEVPQN